MATVIEVMARLSGNATGMVTAMRAGQNAAEQLGTTTQSASGRARAGLTALNADINRNAAHWKTAGNASMVFGAVALAGVAMVVRSYAAFDKQMSGVQSATHATGKDLNTMREAAIKAGADTAFSAVEAAQGIEELSKAGVKVNDILGGGLTGALSLAAAGELGVGAAAEIAASAMTQFQLKGKDLPHVADLLAAAAGKAQGSVEDMGRALNMTGLVAAQTGLSIEETTGGLAAFANAGLIGSDAGTSFKTMLMRLTPNSKEAKAKMLELGISAYNTSGHFIGLAAFAGNLKDSMTRLDPETRAAAMGIIFGSDAVRAANILYREGEAGIRKWIDAVNTAGYAAATAAIKQDNLAGDVEKLGGSLDAVFLKSGSGANAVLRDMVQGLENAVDWVGSLDPKVLSLGLAFTAQIGIMALVIGGFLRLAPAVLGAVTAFRNLGTAGSTVPGMLGKIGKGAGIAMIALMGLQIADTLFSTKANKNAEDYANAMLKVSQAGKDASSSDLDKVFQGYGSVFGTESVQNVNGMADAVRELTNQHFGDWISQNLEDKIAGPLGLTKSGIGQVVDRFKDMGKAMGDMVRNGGADAAAKSFKLLSAEFEKNGKSAQEALDSLPGYSEALMGAANAAGLSLEPHQLLEYALGKIPPGMEQAKAAVETYTNAAGISVPVTEEMAKQLTDLGITAQGAAANLDKLVTSLQNAGLLTQSEHAAARDYAEALGELGMAADGTVTKVLNLQGGFDRNTEAGRANEAMFEGLAKKGMDTTAAMAKTTDAFGENIYTQEQLQSNLTTTYNNMVTAAGQFGITGDKAHDPARNAMGIPKNVNIDTWMSDWAKQMAEKTTGALNQIPRQVNVNIDTYKTTFEKLVGLPASNPPPASIARPPEKWTGGIIRAFAGGGFNGPVNGPGTGTSDSIMAMLSNGEFVTKASSVSKYGVDMMRDINAGTFRPQAATVSSGASYSGASSQSGGSMSFQPNITIELEIPGLGERLTARIKSVSTDTVADALGSIVNEASSGRGTGRATYV